MKRLVSIMMIGAAVALTHSGCASAAAHTGKAPTEPYAGVRHWPSLTKDAMAPTQPDGEPGFGPLAFPFMMVDFPFEVVFDTVFLPSDTIGCLTSHHKSSAEPPSR